MTGQRGRKETDGGRRGERTCIEIFCRAARVETVENVDNDANVYKRAELTNGERSSETGGVINLRKYRANKSAGQSQANGREKNGRGRRVAAF